MVRRKLFVVVNDIFAFIITWASIGFAEKRSLFGHGRSRNNLSRLLSLTFVCSV